MELVERDELLAELHKLLDDARAGSGRIVFVGGEAGVGKTSLVRAFCADLPPGVRVLWGASDPLSTPQPLGPFHDMAIDDESVARVMEGSDRRSLVQGLLQELATPTVMVVEDAHWADEATLDALRFVGRRAHSTRGLVLMTFRDDELGPEHPLRVLLGDLTTAEGTHRFGLVPLTPAGVGALAAGHGLDADDLYRVTGGNPFFVTEVLAGAGAGIPTSVTDAVLARAARLSSAARSVLDVVAVSPGGLELDFVASLVEGAMPKLDECVAHGMLVPDGDRIAFRHELARGAVEASTPVGRRRELHQRLLAHLEARQQTDPARLAHHADAAGDGAAVLRHAPEAARRAGSRGAHREEARHYRRALGQAAELPPLERAALLAALARAEFPFDDSRVPELLQEEIRLRQAVRDPRGEALARGLLGTVSSAHGDVQGGAAAVLDAIALLGELPVGPELALLNSALAHSAFWPALDTQQAISRGHRAIELAERTGQDSALAQALVARGGAELLCGDEARGIADLERAHAAAAGLGDTNRAVILRNVAVLYVKAKRYDDARRLVDEAIELCSATDNDLQLGRTEATLAQLHLEQGAWLDAEHLAERQRDRPATSLSARGNGSVILATIAVRRGAPSDALVAEAARTTHALNHVLVQWMVVSLRAEAAWNSGRVGEIAAIAGAMYARMVEAGYRWAAGELALWLWRADEQHEVPDWIATPHLRRLRGDWRAAADEWEQIGCPYEQADALADGDEPAMREALTIFTRLGAQPAADRVRARMRDTGIKHVPTRPRATTRAAPAGLTRRQLEVLTLLGNGRTNADIARELYITEKTAEHHVSAVLRKLGVGTRGEAVETARTSGILTPGR